MSITKLSPNWACQMGPIHCPKFLLPGSIVYGVVPHQIKSIFVYLMEKSTTTVTDAKVVYRILLGGHWTVTSTDMRNLNKVKNILSFEFSIYGSGDKVSIVLFRE